MPNQSLKLGSFLKKNLVIIGFIFLATIKPASANNLSITNVVLEDRDPSANTVVVTFDVSWDNSWRTKINHDAVWILVRLLDSPSNPTINKLCRLSAGGLNPSGSSSGSNTASEIYVPADKYGAFLRRTSFASSGTVSTTSVKFKIDYSSAGFSSTDSLYANVFGIEMVYIPIGDFYAGDYDTSTSSLDEGSSDADPWKITSEVAISAANPAANGYRYVSNNNSGEDSTGTSFTIPAAFPKGYQGFYSMKYEITEGQWVDFVNSLPAASRSKRDLTDNIHKNSDSVQYRNTISCSGSPLTCSTIRAHRGLNFLSWMDVSAFLDWAALRPMTELEYEKIARGPRLPLKGEYAWGKTDITPAAVVSGNSEDATETITTTNANAHYNNTTLSGGDSALGADYQKGPLRVGIFATSSSNRASAGGGYYGVMELSGNLAELVVSIGNAAGRAYSGSHGDGVLTTASGYEGNANTSGWVGMDADSSHGITGAAGSGSRGGSWEDTSARLRISDRSDAALTASDAKRTYGGRGVRTYDGN